MSIKEAKIVLGEDANSLSDAQIAEEIKAAEPLKNIFFNFKKNVNN